QGVDGLGARGGVARDKGAGARKTCIAQQAGKVLVDLPDGGDCSRAVGISFENDYDARGVGILRDEQALRHPGQLLTRPDHGRDTRLAGQLLLETGELSAPAADSLSFDHDLARADDARGESAGGVLRGADRARGSSAQSWRSRPARP